MENMGNFGVCRGSRRAMAGAVEAHLVGDGDEIGFKHAWWVTHQPAPSGGWIGQATLDDKVPICLKLGQA